MTEPLSDLTRDRWRRLVVPAPDRTLPTVGTAAFVGQVMTTSATAGTFALVNPVTVLGTEAEGGTGSLTVGSAMVPVLMLAAAAAGDRVICRFLDHRWVADRGSHCPSYVCVHVGTCGCVGVALAAVSVTGPAGFTASGTTDTAGNWCVLAGSPGSYTVTVTAGVYVATQTVVVGTACRSYTASFAVVYNPFYLTTGLGTIAMTSLGGGHWSGNRTVDVSTTNWQYDAYGNCVGTPETYSEPITYDLFCASWTLPWSLIITAPVVVESPNDALNIYYYGPPANCRGGVYINGTVNMAGSCTLPFSISGTLPATWNVGGSYSLPALDSGTVVITP